MDPQTLERTYRDPMAAICDLFDRVADLERAASCVYYNQGETMDERVAALNRIDRRVPRNTTAGFGVCLG